MGLVSEKVLKFVIGHRTSHNYGESVIWVRQNLEDRNNAARKADSEIFVVDCPGHAIVQLVALTVSAETQESVDQEELVLSCPVILHLRSVFLQDRQIWQSASAVEQQNR